MSMDVAAVQLCLVRLGALVENGLLDSVKFVHTLVQTGGNESEHNSDEDTELDEPETEDEEDDDGAGLARCVRGGANVNNRTPLAMSPLLGTNVVVALNREGVLLWGSGDLLSYHVGKRHFTQSASGSGPHGDHFLQAHCASYAKVFCDRDLMASIALRWKYNDDVTTVHLVLRRAVGMPWDRHPLAFILPHTYAVGGPFDDKVHQVHLIAGRPSTFFAAYCLHWRTPISLPCLAPHRVTHCTQ
jgi:hypothetical protein